jgi:hypothetical protein
MHIGIGINDKPDAEKLLYIAVGIIIIIIV